MRLGVNGLGCQTVQGVRPAWDVGWSMVFDHLGVRPFEVLNRMRCQTCLRCYMIQSVRQSMVLNRLGLRSFGVLDCLGYQRVWAVRLSRVLDSLWCSHFQGVRPSRELDFSNKDDNESDQVQIVSTSNPTRKVKTLPTTRPLPAWVPVSKNPASILKFECTCGYLQILKNIFFYTF